MQLRAVFDEGTSGLVPRQLVAAACSKQVECLVAVAARSWPADALPTLRSWSLELAHGPIATRLLRLLDFEAVVCLHTLEVTPVHTTRSRDEILAGLAAAGALPHGLLRGHDLVPA